MRMIFSLFALLACCLMTEGMSLSLCADEPGLQKLTAQDILDRMAKAYASCESYQDSGVVKTVFIEADRKHTKELKFTTAFVRPDHFRFEYKEKELGIEDRYIVWRKGKEVRVWWDIDPGIEQPDSLDLALAGATGVSSGSAHTISTLLLPNDVGGRKLINMKKAKRADDAKLDKEDCFRIEGKFAGSPMALWIHQKTFLVRRIDIQHKFDDFRTECTTTYESAINEEIPAKLLEFDPPKPE